MTESKHTPGPWKVYTWQDKVGVTPTSQDADICATSGMDTKRSHDEALANARLIASAPGLSADLKEAIEALRDFRDFVLKNAAQWQIGANHHNPMWQRVAVVLDKHGENQ